MTSEASTTGHARSTCLSPCHQASSVATFGFALHKVVFIPKKSTCISCLNHLLTVPHRVLLVYVLNTVPQHLFCSQCPLSKHLRTYEQVSVYLLKATYYFITSDRLCFFTLKSPTLPPDSVPPFLILTASIRSRWKHRLDST